MTGREPTIAQSAVAWAGRAVPVPGWYALVLDRVAARLASGGPVRASRHGSVAEYDLADFVQRKLFCWSHQEPELAFVAGWCRPGDVVVDAGANVGAFTLCAARAVQPSGTTVAIEANPDTVAALRRNLSLNAYAGVEVRHAALAAEPGRLHLGNIQEADGSGGVTVAGAEGSFAVDAHRLDDLLDEALPGGDRPIRLLKLDTEGYELNVLRGAERTLGGPRRPEVLLVEISEPALARFDASGALLSEALEQHGYRLFARTALGRLRPYEALDEARRAHGLQILRSTEGGLPAGVRRLAWDVRMLTEVVAIAPGVDPAEVERAIRRRRRSRK